MWNHYLLLPEHKLEALEAVLGDRIQTSLSPPATYRVNSPPNHDEDDVGHHR